MSGKRIVMSFSKMDTYLSCPHRYYLSYKDPNVIAKTTPAMIRGTAIHEALSHVSTLYNLVYQQIDAPSHPLAQRTHYLNPIGNFSKDYLPDKPRSSNRYEHEENSAFNMKVARTIAQEILKERNVEDGMMSWSGMLVDRAVKTYNKVLVGNCKASGVWVPKPMTESGKQMLQDHVLRELTTILAPPHSMFQKQLSSSQDHLEYVSTMEWGNIATTTSRMEHEYTSREVLETSFRIDEPNTPESFGMEGSRLPLLIEEPFVLKHIGGREDIDMVFIFDRVDLEREKNVGFFSPFKSAPTDKHVLVEYKTRIKPHNVELYRTQLAMYHYAFKELFGIPADKSYLTCIESGTAYEFDDSEFDSMDTEFMIIDCADQILEDTEWKPNPSKSKCQNCTVSHACKYAYDPNTALVQEQIQRAKERKEQLRASQDIDIE
ncbi:hypothetical protein C9374_009450 [Naegleria lovaniensis]|uniref:PD-(D/E)XK endonuclease-like domain-containing protein n=1 Tax=Naegleria lovaniensis TaxID=51637 RepID=A0AA88KP70_NAELO|nr:uncharacterized protein C9374_009450 [Naegleria lovaniensis]KAG2392873.1 hypothetical protein C9374_009450 [Naegleria lovaniensis]